MPDPRTMEPTRIVQGAALSWLIYDSEFSADDGWVQRFVLVRQSSQFVVDATDNGDGGFLFDLDSATSGTFDPGAYKWRRLADDGTDVFERASGDVVVEPNFIDAVNGLDARTDWEQILDDLVVAYKEFVSANGGRTQFTVAGRTTVFSTAEEFTKAIKAAEHEVQRERRKKSRREGRLSGRSIQTRMP